eukprot:gnl/TRDRNA2_/TRDRNA2_154595_c0_seq1.p1 gnl/TRDRNA2_/TRDRNA2_154595_c0~~gnl/TRDRNA2_/TRDRNA2_154595_c0_seq1.p1  ORF type:complete len:138 (+),score=12.36 gnl/TRDRNA2_/TRDRNA2_154595_c0_seq1:2-415(+)
MRPSSQPAAMKIAPPAASVQDKALMTEGNVHDPIAFGFACIPARRSYCTSSRPMPAKNMFFVGLGRHNFATASCLYICCATVPPRRPSTRVIPMLCATASAPASEHSTTLPSFRASFPMETDVVLVPRVSPMSHKRT